MKQPANRQFGLSVLATDQRHGTAALLWREIIHCLRCASAAELSTVTCVFGRRG